MQVDAPQRHRADQPALGLDRERHDVVARTEALARVVLLAQPLEGAREVGAVLAQGPLVVAVVPGVQVREVLALDGAQDHRAGAHYAPKPGRREAAPAGSL